MDKLKPCPFCGHEAMSSHNTKYDFQVYCTNDSCFMSQIIMEGMETEDHARAAWNKRAPSVPAVPLEPLCQWLAGYAAPPNYAMDEVRDDSIDPESLVYTANDRAKAWEFHFRQLMKSGLMDTEEEDEQKET